jgi:xanthosine phosphorylase
MSSSTPIHQAATYLTQRTHGFKPQVGIILGSGLAELVNEITDARAIPYAHIPNFFDCSVSGHSGLLHFGYLEGVPVVCMQGRGHYYEGLSGDDIATPIRTMKFLGVETLLITNAAGSLKEAIEPGNLMLISDHINLQGRNPLVGNNDSTLGPRFLGMEGAYNLELRHQMLETAQSLGIPLAQGTYVAVLGPVFETPAEIRAFQILGGDAVGMSTVPEVIAAHHCGLKVVAISMITNMGAGMSSEILTHEGTLKGAQLGIQALKQLVHAFILKQKKAQSS